MYLVLLVAMRPEKCWLYNWLVEIIGTKMAKQYSIWILAEEVVQQQLGKEVKRLSRLYGGKKFEPHMTLVGDVKQSEQRVVEAAEKLAETTNKFKVELGEVTFSTTYFQCVFVRVKATPALMDLNVKAKEYLRLPESVFMPHFSLLYGHQEMKVREEMVQSVGLKVQKTMMEKLVVIPAVQEPSEWKHLAEFGLS